MIKEILHSLEEAKIFISTYYGTIGGNDSLIWKGGNKARTEAFLRSSVIRLGTAGNKITVYSHKFEAIRIPVTSSLSYISRKGTIELDEVEAKKIYKQDHNIFVKTVNFLAKFGEDEEGMMNYLRKQKFEVERRSGKRLNR